MGLFRAVVNTENFFLRGFFLMGWLILSKAVMGQSLAVEKGTYLAGQTVTVKFSNILPDDDNWITVVPSSTPVEQWAQYHWTHGNRDGELEFDQELEIGNYEARLYYNWDGGSDAGGKFKVIAKVGFEVKLPDLDDCDWQKYNREKMINAYVKNVKKFRKNTILTDSKMPDIVQKIIQLTSDRLPETKRGSVCQQAGHQVVWEYFQEAKHHKMFDYFGSLAPDLIKDILTVGQNKFKDMAKDELKDKLKELFEEGFKKAFSKTMSHLETRKIGNADVFSRTMYDPATGNFRIVLCADSHCTPRNYNAGNKVIKNLKLAHWNSEIGGKLAVVPNFDTREVSYRIVGALNYSVSNGCTCNAEGD